MAKMLQSKKKIWDCEEKGFEARYSLEARGMWKNLLLS